MTKYAIKVTTQAQEHILNYASYIKYELLNPLAAQKFVRNIWKEIQTLETMPQRFPCIDDDPWKTMQIHRMIYKGYIVYFLLKESTSEVIVIGVILEKRNQREQLEKLLFE